MKGLDKEFREFKKQLISKQIKLMEKNSVFRLSIKEAFVAGAVAAMKKANKIVETHDKVKEEG